MKKVAILFTLSAIFVASATIATPAQEPTEEIPTFEYEAQIGSDGKLVIVPKGPSLVFPEIIQPNSQKFEAAISAADRSGMSAADRSGMMEAFVQLSSDGKVTGVYHGDPNNSEFIKAMGNLPKGYSMVKAGYFTGGYSILPTIAEVKSIISTAINTTMDVVCALKHRPNKIKTEIDVAVSLGLEGRFKLSLDWNPSEACQN